MMDRIAQWIAWQLPRRLVKWCGFRIGAHATQGQWSAQEVPVLSFMDAMRRWEIGRRVLVVTMPEGEP